MVQTITIQVKEIHCEGCEHTITTAFSSLDGVLRTTASSKTNEVKVSYDEAKIDETGLRAKLSEVGYDPVN